MTRAVLHFLLLGSSGLLLSVPEPAAAACDSGAAVCLDGGNSSSEGNVYVRGRPVCDDLWSITDANVVCRQLNFSRAKNATWQVERFNKTLHLKHFL